MQVRFAFIAAGAMFFELPKRLINKVNAAEDPLGTQRRIVSLSTQCSALYAFRGKGPSLRSGGLIL